MSITNGGVPSIEFLYLYGDVNFTKASTPSQGSSSSNSQVIRHPQTVKCPAMLPSSQLPRSTPTRLPIDRIILHSQAAKRRSKQSQAPTQPTTIKQQPLRYFALILKNTTKASQQYHTYTNHCQNHGRLHLPPPLQRVQRLLRPPPQSRLQSTRQNRQHEPSTPLSNSTETTLPPKGTQLSR